MLPSIARRVKSENPSENVGIFGLVHRPFEFRSVSCWTKIGKKSANAICKNHYRINSRPRLVLISARLFAKSPGFGFVDNWTIPGFGLRHDRGRKVNKFMKTKFWHAQIPEIEESSTITSLAQALNWKCELTLYCQA